MKKFIANTAAVMAAICMTVPAMPVMAATSEADFEGVWKCESLSAFGFDFDAADYGMDDSYLTIQDGKLSVFSSSGYTEGEEVKDLDLEFADGKYTLKLDEDSAKKVSGESDDLLAGMDKDTKEKVEALLDGNTSRIEFESDEAGKLKAVIYIDIDNDALKFATHFDLDFVASTDAELEAAKADAEAANEIDGIDEDMTLDDGAADDAATADIVTEEV